MSRRRRPDIVRVLQIPFAGTDPSAFDSQPPQELHLEPTGSSGETAIWLDDFFWLDLIQRWPRQQMTVHLKPTPDSLLHPVILHQLNMLRRVCPEWRLVGYCYVGDLAADGRLAQAAMSVYHEVHVIDSQRPGSKHEQTQDLDEVIERLRTIQQANKRATPTFVPCRSRHTVSDETPGNHQRFEPVAERELATAAT